MHTLEQLQSGALAGTSHLKIAADLTRVPAEIYQLADTLEVLDLSGNRLHELPEAITCLTRLRILFLSDNDFTVFPEVLKGFNGLDIVGFKANNIKTIPEHAIPVSLRWLILTDNCIEMLPASIGLCTRLQKVMLAGNRLKVLPEELAACRAVELLRISANCITRFPEVLKKLPRLTWLACAGNPFHTTIPTGNTLPAVSWDSLELQEQLGAGASGIIHRALWKQGNTVTTVAVKLFKGTVTSDGLPRDEMAACLRAGSHEHIVAVRGTIENHPSGTQGLVMELIPADYKNLGGPPSFVTCTRDTFPAETRFTATQVLIILNGIAAAAGYLHDRGIMHGDLYAHNTLINKHNHSLFGDFGAASLYDRNDSEAAFFLERMEVRAFGCLADDLLHYCVPSTENMPLLEALKNLSAACMTEAFAERPDFKTIREYLNAL